MATRSINACDDCIDVICLKQMLFAEHYQAGKKCDSPATGNVALRKMKVSLNINLVSTHDTFKLQETASIGGDQ